MSYGFNNYSSLGLTLGLAALGLAAYSLRHQEARAFAWIRNRLGTTRTIDSVGRGTLETIPASSERLTPLLDPTHAEALVKLFSRCTFPNKPTFHGTLMEQALEIGNWMRQNQTAIETVKALDLSDLNLTTVPQEIRLFHNLKILNLHKNQLSIPPDVSANPQLTELSLYSNQLSIPPDVRCKSPANRTQPQRETN